MVRRIRLDTKEKKIALLLELLGAREDEEKRRKFQELSDAELDMRIAQSRRLGNVRRGPKRSGDYHPRPKTRPSIYDD